MKHGDNTVFAKRIATAILISIASSCISFPLQAVMISGGAEMGLALAAIPFDAAAHHYDFDENYKKKAALLHLTTDMLSLLNKALFFYNNIRGQMRFGDVHCNRDCVVMGAFAARDLTKWYKHLKDYKQAPADGLLPASTALLDMAADDQDDDGFIVLDDIIEQKLEPEQLSKIARLEYGLRVFVLPTLKGLTACAMAYTQDRARFGACQEERFALAAAYSMIRIIEECTELGADSGYKKLLILVLLAANAGWVAKELKTCIDKWTFVPPPAAPPRPGVPARGGVASVPPAPAPRAQHVPPPPLAVPQECPVCTEESVHFRALSCGHSYCRDCWVGHVDAERRNGGLADLHCMSCAHVLTDVDVRNVTDNDRELCDAHTDALFERWRTGAAGARHCPTPDCPNVFENDQNIARPHNCPGCHQYYCANCLVQHVPGARCRDAVRDAVNTDPANAAWIRDNARECPNCGVAVQRTEGCNHMTCRCRHEFCYIDGAPWNRDHYQCRRAPVPDGDDFARWMAGNRIFND